MMATDVKQNLSIDSAQADGKDYEQRYIISYSFKF